MGVLEGKVAIVTGAGRGIGREHALLLAAEGAAVVVNDLGGSTAGEGSDAGPAASVVAEIEAAGGRAVANTDDISDWDGAARLVAQAVDMYGQLDVLVNNAGILRDRMLVSMQPEEWDVIVRVHLRGHFCPTRHAAAHWRACAKAGDEVRASVINTSSTSGLVGNVGQTNYGAAKAGIGAFTVIAAQELGRYGVRVNAIAPAARTRLTEATPGLGETVTSTSDATFDPWDPANISPAVAYLASDLCPVTGAVFFVQGGVIKRFRPWRLEETIRTEGRWTVQGITDAIDPLLTPDPVLQLFEDA